jgi:hypothetical protein
VLKQLDSYCQTNITRKDLVILQEKKQRNDSRNTIVIIALLFLPPFSLEPLESEIPTKHLDHEPKILDLPDLTEPKLNT